MRASAMKEVAAAIAPCVKFTTRVERQISTRASANAAKIMPWTNPARVTLMNWCTGCLSVVAGWTGGLDGAGPGGSEAQIGVPQRFVGEQVLSLVGDDHPAEVQHDADVGHGQRAAGVLLHQQHRQAL